MKWKLTSLPFCQYTPYLFLNTASSAPKSHSKLVPQTPNYCLLCDFYHGTASPDQAIKGKGIWYAWSEGGRSLWEAHHLFEPESPQWLNFTWHLFNEFQWLLDCLLAWCAVESHVLCDSSHSCYKVSRSIKTFNML